MKPRGYGNVTIASVFLMALTTLAIWAQVIGVFSDGGTLDSAGGRLVEGNVEVIGSLGSWFSTVSIQNSAGVRVVSGAFLSGTTAGVVGDLDGDSDVDFGDFLLFAKSFGTSTGDALFNPKSDFDSDGTVDFSDFLVFAAAFGS